MSRLRHRSAEERRRLVDAYRRRPSDESSWFGHEDEAHGHRLAERYRLTRQLLAAKGWRSLTGRKVLDIGCGDGHFLLELLQWGAEPQRLAGIDLRPEPLAIARRRVPETPLALGCASALPWPNGAFDLVCLQTVFSSILDPELRCRVAEEAERVLAPGGAVLIYDSRRANPGNADVQALTAEQLLVLFPSLEGPSRSLTFLPHVARRLPPALLGRLYPLLAAVPAWRSHMLALLNKTRGAE